MLAFSCSSKASPMRGRFFVFQLVGSLLAIACLASLAIELGGKARAAGPVAAPAAVAGLSPFPMRVGTPAAATPTPRSQAEADGLVARAVAEQEMRHP
jgi:hypothetical protein